MKNIIWQGIPMLTFNSPPENTIKKPQKMNIILFIWKGPLGSLNQCISHSVNPSLSFKAFLPFLWCLWVFINVIFIVQFFLKLFSRKNKKKKMKTSSDTQSWNVLLGFRALGFAQSMSFVCEHVRALWKWWAFQKSLDLHCWCFSLLPWLAVTKQARAAVLKKKKKESVMLNFLEYWGFIEENIVFIFSPLFANSLQPKCSEIMF